MKLTKDQVLHVAKLARMRISDQEAEVYAGQLSGCLEYMEILNELDTSKVEPTAQVTGLLNVARADTVEPCVKREDLLSTTLLPLENHQIRVKGVFS